MCVTLHPTDEVRVEGVSVAAVYGVASKPLCMAMEAVTDLITAYTAPGCTLPFLSPPNTSMEPDFVFLRRLTLLAVHTMFAQQHWESLISAGLRLCAAVRVGGGEEGRRWVGDVVPVILSAQCRLSERVKQHHTDLKREG